MLKFTNHTRSIIWMEDYCFVPGVTTADVPAAKIKKIKVSMAHKDWKDAIDKKLIEIDYDFKEEVKEEVKTDVKETK